MKQKSRALPCCCSLAPFASRKQGTRSLKIRPSITIRLNIFRAGGRKRFSLNLGLWVRSVLVEDVFSPKQSPREQQSCPSQRGQTIHRLSHPSWTSGGRRKRWPWAAAFQGRGLRQSLRLSSRLAPCRDTVHAVLEGGYVRGIPSKVISWTIQHPNANN